ncbi:extracellular solute-binding protein [Coralliovum pocilloporae]|uniref:extracellular solute-binding protein n=1 Tax=Coralliovum pocilloporae TaxID=3066369 RepID=UPI003306C8FF
MLFLRLLVISAFMVASAGTAISEETYGPAHGIAMHGEPKLPADFTHFPYANPDAPKGGRIVYAMTGTFDSLNPFITKGVAPRGLWDGLYGRNVYDSLLARNRDEAFALYGLVAESVETAADRRWIRFRLRPEARFADGTPITADDVAFTVELLKTKGRGNYRIYYSNVERVEVEDTHTVLFRFSKADRELALLIGLMPVLPKHAIDVENFDQTSFDAVPGSGPYKVDSVDPGKRIILKRDPDYWGKDLPVRRGFSNFDEIVVDYYRDGSARFEAFKKGLFDLNAESDPGRWSDGYGFPAVKDGRVVLDRFTSRTPKPMASFVFNTRRPVFQDIKVRQALALLFDFEWINKNLYFGLYTRSESYFHGSVLSALERAADPGEKALLKDFPDAVTPEVMDGTYRVARTDGSGRDRRNMRTALSLLQSAGYVRKANRLVHKVSGEPLAFEFMAVSTEQEKLALTYAQVLKRLGIEMTIRTVDSAQYQRRRQSFDFDMIQFVYAASLSPGNEQNFRWRSDSADLQGSFNMAGVRNPAADAMIDALLNAVSEEEFIAAVRALDRVLISGYYVVPLFHAGEQWVARSARIGRPKQTSAYGYQPMTWWAK